VSESEHGLERVWPHIGGWISRCFCGRTVRGATRREAIKALALHIEELRGA